MAEAGGFEPPVSCDTAVFKTAAQSSQPPDKQGVEDHADGVLGVSLGALGEKAPDLAAVVAAWPALPEHVRATILMLVRSVHCR